MRSPESVIVDLKEMQETRIQAAFALESRADETAIAALGSCLAHDPSPIVRHEAAFALGETACPRLALPHLRKAVLEDSDPFVRHEALLAIATLGVREEKAFIRQFLSDADSHVAESAEIALQRLEG